MTVYTPPATIEKPDVHPLETYGSRLEAYEQQIVAFCKANSKSKYSGKSIRFQVADGYATYYVFKLSPLTLIWDDSGDAYQFPYVDRLTASDIKQEVAKQEALKQFFSSKK